MKKYIISHKEYLELDDEVKMCLHRYIVTGQVIITKE
jgi:hypothetical protein